MAVSKLKQQMRRARGPLAVAPVGPSQRIQTLELQGNLKAMLGDMEMAKNDPELADKRLFVGAWVGRDVFVHAERAADGSVSLSVPVDTEADVDTLKLQLYCLMTDPETRLSKPFPLAESVASLGELASGRPTRVQFDDPIMGGKPSVLKLTARTRVDTSRLRRSAMYDAKASNDAMQALARRVGEAIKANRVRVPKVAAAFVEGLGFLPSGGNAAMGIPPVMTHYGALSGLVDRVERRLPHSLLAYYLQLALTQEGLTMKQALALPDRDFAKFGGDVLWGTTRDAGAFPYQRDCTETVGIQLTPKGMKIGLQPVTTEDIGLPFAASNFIARDLRPPPAPAVLASDAAPGGAYRQFVDAVRAGEWPELNVALGIDDCETSGMAGKLAASTVRDLDMGPQAFQRGLEFTDKGKSDFHIFQSWTKKDVDMTSQFFTRLQGMMRDGSLNVSLVVGLAGGASATIKSTTETAAEGEPSQDIDQMDGLGGHCFAVLRLQRAGGDLYVRLLEGTSCVKICTEPADGPAYTCCMEKAEGQGKGEVMTTTLSLTGFLTLLSSSVSESTRAVNQVIGGGTDGEAAGGGIPAGKTLAGFIRPSIAMPCLHSLIADGKRASELAFYKWCLYTGLTADPTDLGTLPLDTSGPKGGLGAGCRPMSLASDALQGFGIDMDKADFEAPRAVLDEVWPPIASPAQFRAVLNLWAPLPSLGSVNADLSAVRQPGVEYETVTCMETPAAPGLAEHIYRLKAALAALANKINAARPDSDGISMTVARIGTGVHATLHVPRRSLTLTFTRSLREAKAQMGWARADEKTQGQAARY
jgi:hypothetical protein